LIVLPKLYPILDTLTLQARGLGPTEAAEALIEAGCRLLQFRHKGPFTRAVFAEAAAVAGLCRAAGALFIVNDRADIAAMLGAGLHLGQDDLGPRDARKVVPPGTIIGLSTHNEAQMREAADEPVDYVAIGPIFVTGSKENPDPALGIDELRRIRHLTARPLVAIGGITEENAASVLSAGADSVALIGGLFTTQCSTAQVREQARRFLA